ncbi:restriction endonuclease subunit S [Vibrio parahaemolyticus]|nr:restriction endonuclease subunit S [Vibrio parahaemolyticus]
MSCNWPRVQISEVCELIVDCVNKTAPRVDYETPFKMIRTPNVKGGKITLNDCRFVEEDTYEKWTRRAKVLRDDVLLTREAPMGEVGIVDFDETVFLGQRIMQYRADRSKLDPHFLLYSFLSSDLQHQFNMHEGSGSVVSHIRVPDCSKFELNLPPLDVQKDIAGVLKKLDRKISVNQQTNQTLEQMAQAIFKSWFVDFDPVKAKMNGEQPEGMDAATASLFPEKLVESEIGLIPEGWVETPLYDIAEYINGAAYKKFEPNNEGIGLPIVKIAELKAGITQKTGFSTVDMPAKYRLEDNDILFSWSGNPDTSIDTFVWALGEAWLNQHIFKVVPKSVLSRDYVLCLLKFMRPVFAEIARDKQTTGLGHVTVKDLKRLTVALPSEELLIKFNEKVSAIIAQNFSLVKQNQNLEKLRDTLLPKLLSGEIELGATEAMEPSLVSSPIEQYL